MQYPNAIKGKRSITPMQKFQHPKCPVVHANKTCVIYPTPVSNDPQTKTRDQITRCSIRLRIRRYGISRTWETPVLGGLGTTNEEIALKQDRIPTGPCWPRHSHCVLDFSSKFSYVSTAEYFDVPKQDYALSYLTILIESCYQVILEVHKV